jgi:hypothetical protein
MKRILMLLMTTFILLGNAIADPGSSLPSVDELMHKSGLWLQVAQIEPLVQIGVMQELAKTGEREESDIGPLRQAITTAYGAERLRDEVRNQLALSLAQGDVDDVLAWLSSDLGQRLTALEEKSGEVNEYLQRQEDASIFLRSLSSKRIEIIRRFTKAIRAGEASASIVINTTVGMTYGMSVVNSRSNIRGISEIKRKLESQKAQLIRMFERQSISQFAVIYQSVSDRDLNKYISFAKSPAGRRYHAASIQALDIALTRAATEIGRELGVPTRSASNNGWNPPLNSTLQGTEVGYAPFLPLS